MMNPTFHKVLVKHVCAGEWINSLVGLPLDCCGDQEVASDGGTVLYWIMQVSSRQL